MNRDSQHAGRIHPARQQAARLALCALLALACLALLRPGVPLPNGWPWTLSRTEALMGALDTARAAAIRAGRSVFVVANNGQWTQGWIVTTNPALDSMQCGGRSRLPSVLLIDCGTAATEWFTAPTTQIEFRADGGATATELRLCSARGCRPRIVIGPTGQALLGEDRASGARLALSGPPDAR